MPDNGAARTLNADPAAKSAGSSKTGCGERSSDFQTEMHKLAGAAEFGAMLQLARRTEPTRTVSRCSRLPVVPCEVRERPYVVRFLGHVKAALAEVFASLCDGKRPWPLYLYGDAGNGKTYAALALCDWTAGRYWMHEELCDDIIRTEFQWPTIGQAPLAVLDDIGVRDRVNDLSYTAVLRFWEQRERQQGRAIYATNLTPEALKAQFDDRIASRLLCGTVLKLTDTDRRKAR
jgi:hypothetical protein